MEKFYRKLNLAVKSFDVAKMTADFVISTPDQDRHGDIVEQVWDLANYRQNPVVLNSHRYDDLIDIIGKMIKIGVVTVVQGIKQLQGTIQFAVEENPKAKIAFDLITGGYLNAVSAGFIPKEFGNDNHILKSELLEVSLVAVPANQMALAKAKGINVDELYAKDNDADGGADAGNAGQGKGNDGDDTAAGGDDSKANGAGSDENSGGGAGDGGTDDAGAGDEADSKQNIEVAVDELDEANKCLKIINDLDALLGELEKVETRSCTAKAIKRRAFNKTIRNLIKVKKFV